MVKKNNPAILNRLRAGKERITPVRLALVYALGRDGKPRTPQELLRALAKQGLKANKTTVYRQLETLERYKIINAVYFADRAKRYELADESGHHHHLVCLRCQRVVDVNWPADLKKYEQEIWQKNKFKVRRHSLEFFGLCQACQGQKKNLGG